MSDPPSSSGPRVRPSSYLRKACMNCRRRKIRCDGERPVCRQCRLRPPRSLVPCKYSHAPVDGGSASPGLEEMVEAMQYRINQLEASSGQDPSQIFLSDPYPNSNSQTLSLPGTEHWSPRRCLEQSAFSIPVAEPYGGAPTLTRAVYVRDRLPFLLAIDSDDRLDIFLLHFVPRDFFFLYASNIRHALVDPPDPNQVSLGLLNAMYLWASRISPEATRKSEAEFLALTVDRLARDVAAIQAIQPPNRILQIIQAAVLLSLYYLDSGRLIEGKYYCAAATSLALSAGLHQLAPAPHPPHLHPPPAFSPRPLVLPADSIRANEMIDGFWSVVLLNNYWIAASGVPSCIPYDTSFRTPWPTRSTTQTATTTNNFPEQHSGEDPRTMLIQASMLLQRTTAFTSRDPGLVHSPELLSLAHQLDEFRNYLDAAAAVPELTLIPYALVNAAIIRLHAPHRQDAALAAANRVVARLNIAPFNINSEWDRADPILGPLLSTVADVYISHLSLPSADLNTILSGLTTVFSALSALARGSALIHHCLAEAQQRYSLVSFPPL
ncbi:hypothetical protein DFH09DRAFT_1285462 [Mycena vulgaris]|nr:hypothetical protein DFH09DRAFT_1285462 [Mycena vulgaris]